MLGNLIYYYASGHTGKGYVQYWQSNIENIEQIIVLQHPSLTYKTKCLEAVIQRYEKEYDIEIVLSPFGKDDIEGIIVREKSVAILNGMHVANVSEVVPLINHIEKEVMDDTVRAEHEINNICHGAYALLAESLQIHDQLEDIFINEMDFRKADMLIASVTEELFGHVEKKDKKSIIYERLFGTKTPDGTTNYLASIIHPIENRYFIKGRAGTGKSHFMKAIVAMCEIYGLDVELYRCSFDPDSIDLVVIRDLQVCLFDSTPPHELHPSRDEDIIIDLYTETVTVGTDELYAKEIQEINETYLGKMKEGVHLLKDIKAIQQKLDASFKMDIVNTDQIIKKVEND